MRAPAWIERLSPLSRACLYGLFSLAVLALTAPLLPLAPPNAENLDARLVPPLSGHGLLGTDQLGRDMLSRVIFALRLSLGGAALATLVALVLGGTLGLVAAYWGRKRPVVDTAAMRGVDILLAFPYLLLALAIVAALGPGIVNALIAVALVNIPFFARTLRGAAWGLAEREFVTLARLANESHFAILVRQILPNMVPPILVAVSTTFGWMILETAGLSFLGLGAQPPTAELGAMLGQGRALFLIAPHIVLVPGFAIVAIVLMLTLLADGLRDALDPRLAGLSATRPASATEAMTNEANKAGEQNRLGVSDNAPNRRFGKADRPPGLMARPRGAGEQSEPGVSDITPSPLLSVRDLCVHLHTSDGAMPLVRGMSFDVAKGECLGLVGESGSGKSLSMLALARLLPSPPMTLSGSVRFLGEEVLAMRAEDLRRVRGQGIAYVFQDPGQSLDPLMPVGRQIAEALPHGTNAAEAVPALLRDVGLADTARVAGALPSELSGGMRQRAAIAVALAGEPSLIVADEPTTALDTLTQDRILTLMGDLAAARGLAMIFISHDLGVVRRVADRLAVAYSGQIVEQGSAEEVLNDPAHPYTQALIASTPRLGTALEALAAIEGEPPAPTETLSGCRFAPRCRLAEQACTQYPIVLEPAGPERIARCRRLEEALRRETTPC